MEEEAGEGTPTCPLCAEPVKAAAVVCPHCRGQIRNGFLSDTYRNRPGRQIAGVAIALADVLGVSVTFVRLVFVVLTFVNFLGPVIYMTLWLFLPAETGGVSYLAKLLPTVPGENGERSILERTLEKICSLYSSTCDKFRSRKKKITEPPQGSGEAAERTS